MELISFKKGGAEISFSESELLILNAALNEICNGIDLEEFETRMGSDREEVSILLGKIGFVLDKISIA